MSKKRQHKKKETKSLLDVIMITGGRFDMLRKCLTALEAQKDAPPFGVILIDNATDNQERLRNKDLFEHPLVSNTKRLTQSIGFPAANNEAVNMGSAPLILLLNDDVTLEPDAIKQMVGTMDREEIGVVGAKLVFPENSSRGPAGKVQHVGMGMTINGDINHPLIGWSPDNPKCCVSREVFAVTGACMMTRRNLWKKAGGFYEGYGLGTWEEVDYQRSVKTLGKSIWINADAKGTHYVGATVEKKQIGYPLQQNAMIFRARWAQSGFFEWTDYKMW